MEEQTVLKALTALSQAHRLRVFRALVVAGQAGLTPGQIADAVVYLARAEAVTGQTIFVDGGAHLAPLGRDFVALERD